MRTSTAPLRVTTSPIYVSYLRFSTPEQAEGDSTRRQTVAAESWAAKRGVTLTPLSDPGVSAYRGSNRKGALARFLALVEEGTVPPGSCLIVEDLDRLSRQAPEDALGLFLSIISAGVTIVTLRDGQEYKRGGLDMQRLMNSVMRMVLAHEESAKKSDRIGKAWAAKREAMKKGLVPKPSRLPAWLKWDGTSIVVDEGKADVIRQIFALALAGHGTFSICRHLNGGTGTVARRSWWGRSYVQKILRNPQVIGQFQPMRVDMTGPRRVRVPAGEPVAGYYPPIIPDETYYGVQARLTSAPNPSGPASDFINIFAKLLHNADDGSAMVVQRKSSRRTYASLASIEGRKGAAPYIGLPVLAIEIALLYDLAEVAKIDVDDHRQRFLTRELSAVEGRFAEVASQVAKLKAALAHTGNVVAAVEALAELEGQKSELEKERRRLEAEVANTDAVVTADAEAVIDRIVAEHFADVNNPDRRLALRTAVRRLVQRIDITATRTGLRRSFTATITLMDGRKSEVVGETHDQCPGTVWTFDPMGNRNGVIIGDEELTTKRPIITAEKVDQVRDLWRQSVRPVLIAEQAGVSLQTVYRVCKGIKRERPFKPGSRWEGHKPKKRDYKAERSKRDPEKSRAYMREYMRRRRAEGFR